MIDPIFRPYLPKLAERLIWIYKKIGVTPNQLTVFGLVLSCAAAGLVATNHFFAAIITWWLSRLLDGTDGILARETNQASAFGAFLDISLDMASYSVMIIGLAYAFPALSLQWSIILLMYVLCITGALALGNLESKMPALSADNRGLRLASGIAEGGETGIAYTLFLLFPSHLEELTVAWIIILTTTVLARILLARRELK